MQVTVHRSRLAHEKYAKRHKPQLNDTQLKGNQLALKSKKLIQKMPRPIQAEISLILCHTSELEQVMTSSVAKFA